MAAEITTLELSAEEWHLLGQIVNEASNGIGLHTLSVEPTIADLLVRELIVTRRASNGGAIETRSLALSRAQFKDVAKLCEAVREYIDDDVELSTRTGATAAEYEALVSRLNSRY